MHPTRAPCAGRLQPIGRAAQHRCLWAAQHSPAAPIGLPRLDCSVSRPAFSHALAARWRPRSASGAMHAQAADDDGLGSEQRSEAGCSSSGRQQQQHGLQNLQGIAASALRTTVAVSTVLLAGLATAVRPAYAAAARSDPMVASTSQSLPSRSSVSAQSVRGAAAACDEVLQDSLSPDVLQPKYESREALARRLDALYEQYTGQDAAAKLSSFSTDAPKAAQASSKSAGVDHTLPPEVAAQRGPQVISMSSAAASSLAWTNDANALELPYSQFWLYVSEGLVHRVQFDNPGPHALVALLGPSAPGGLRTVVVALPHDPLLLDHLSEHGVVIEPAVNEAQRLSAALADQFVRYLFPFMLLSMAFWALHSMVLDPMPNAFKRQEFIRYRREMLYITSKLNFRSPAREVRIDKKAPDFIAWDDINGIDSVKREIEEIIEYLKNPALMRSQGVARIGGVLLAGAPGTGKTLLAKSIAAESGVRMFTCSGTDFVDVYSGVGARRIRETFDRMRKNAPAILFVDEFDALGAARGAAASGDESASIINEILVQMDGFEDNTGIIVLGATNRPGAIDSALIRPGRFDRIIYMPLPDSAGRAKILQVHARDKRVDPNLNWNEVARAMSGFTGADCMGLMLRAQGMAARQGRDRIEEEDLYAAMENKAMESFSEMTASPKPGQDIGVPDPIPEELRRAIAVYEAGKVLTAYITPEFEEIARVSICPCNLITGYTLFMEDEGKTMDTVVLRADLESHMVVNLAGRCAEKLVMGEQGATSLGATDVFQANMIAREMIMSMGMGRRMGPVDLMQVSRAAEATGSMLRGSDPRAPPTPYYYHQTDMSTEQARIAQGEVVELIDAAEAKAYYGLAINWKPLQALSQALLDRGVLQGREVAHILESNGVVHFSAPHIDGYGWDKRDGTLVYPLKPVREAAAVGATSTSSSTATSTSEAPPPAPPAPILKGIKGKTWFAGTPLDAPRNEDGSFKHGWHWNIPGGVPRR